MGKVYISAIEAGIDTDEVTARPSDVLVGKTTIDDDGEVVSGSMPDNSTRTSNGNVSGVTSDYTNIPTRQADFSIASTTTDRNEVFNMSPPKGYYPGNGQSYVNVPLSTFGNARQNQVLSGSSFTSENGFRINGNIPRIANDTQSPLHGPVGSSHYRVHLSSNGYYEESDNRPSVLVDLEQICNNIGVDTSKMLDTLQIGNRRGTIPFCSFEQYAHNLWIDNNVNEVFISLPEGYYKKVEPGNEWTPRIRVPWNTLLQKLGLLDQTVFDGASFFGFMKDGAVSNTSKIPYGHGLVMKMSHVDRRYTIDSVGTRYTHDSLWCGYRGNAVDDIGFVSYRPIPFQIYGKVRLTFSVHAYERITTDVEVYCGFLGNSIRDYYDHNESRPNGPNAPANRPVRPLLSHSIIRKEVNLSGGNNGTYTLTFGAEAMKEFAFLCFRFSIFGNSVKTSGAIDINKIELLH